MHDNDLQYLNTLFFIQYQLKPKLSVMQAKWQPRGLCILILGLMMQLFFFTNYEYKHKQVMLIAYLFSVEDVFEERRLGCKFSAQVRFLTTNSEFKSY